jgi:hypothetical protein
MLDEARATGVGGGECNVGDVLEGVTGVSDSGGGAEATSSNGIDRCGGSRHRLSLSR